MPPMPPPPGIAGAAFFFGASATMASVVSMRAAMEEAFCRAARVTFFGSTTPDDPDPAYWEMLVTSSDDRPLGLEVGQLLAVAKSFDAGQRKIRLETSGIRSQVVALMAAAIEPALFSEIYSDNAMNSFSYLLDTPVPYRMAADLFCLDLYKYFDIDRLATIASPVEIAIGKLAGPLPSAKTP